MKEALSVEDTLKLALEALEESHPEAYRHTITAIKEALAQPELCKYGQEPKSCTSSPMDCQCAIDATLAQPEQEPVAHVVIVGNMVSVSTGSNGLKELHKLGDGAPLYSIPPQRTFVGLTDEEFEDIELGCRSTPFGKIEAMKKVETKLKEKNAS